MLLIKVFLKLSECEGISFLVGAILRAILLQTLISEMHLLIFVLNVVLLATCAQVAFLVVVNMKFLSQETPHTNVKLTVFVEKRFLYVFLDHPITFFERKDVIGNLFSVLEDLNATTLVKSRWFNHPHVL